MEFEQSLQQLMAQPNAHLHETATNLLANLEEIPQSQQQTATTAKRPPIRLRTLLVAAIALAVLLSATVLASALGGWRLLDIFNRNNLTLESLPGAEALITTPLAQQTADFDIADFTVLETLYDGENLFLAIEATPKRADVLLINGGSGDPEGADAYMRDLGPRFSDSDELVIDYLQANELTGYRLETWRVYEPKNTSSDAETAVEGPFQSWEISHVSYEEDDSIIILLELSGIDPDTKTINLEIGLHPTRITESRHLIDEGDASAWQHQTLSLEADLSNTAPVLVSTEPFVLEKFGFRVDEVRFVYTKMATYVYFYATINDRDTYESLKTYFPPRAFLGARSDFVVTLPSPMIYSTDGDILQVVGYGYGGGISTDGISYTKLTLPAMEPTQTSYRIDFNFAPTSSTNLTETHTIELMPQE
jgi:hypothetical protein